MHEKKEHISVLLEESIDLLELKNGGIYMDFTFGAGGHSKRILEMAKELDINIKLISLDRDPTTQKFADELKEKYPNNFYYFNIKFSEFESSLKGLGIEKVDGILMDLGFSSMQVDNAERGFSFLNDGPLDMRMGDKGQTAEDFVYSADERDIANVIFKFGDEKKSRRIARAIVNKRNNEKIDTTKKLADIVESVIGSHKGGAHPATRTFQAIRIYINQEFEELEAALEKSINYLNENGILSIITFHSGEDAIVKHFFKEKAGLNRNNNRYLPEINVENSLLNKYLILTRKPTLPSEAEVESNIRSRSAKLRGLKKVKS